jgi:serine/threonine protein kinase
MNPHSPFTSLNPQDGLPAMPGSTSRADTLNAHMDTPSGSLEKPASVLRFQTGAEPVTGYHLVRMLGRGGFGEVWEATGPGGFPLAMKFVHLHGSGGHLEVRSLEVMKNIRHPHLLGMFGAWKTNDYLIVAMELGDKTLKDRLEECAAQAQLGIPPRELIEYMREAAKGIDFLNEPLHKLADGPPQGIQHRDIKPQNLLLVGGSVKVADFGLAKLLEKSVESASGSMSPAYAAPEFCSGQATRWSDQYSLAVTYCQLRGGRLPFTGNLAQLVSGHLSHAPDLSMIPTAKEREILSRALLKQPSARWASCRELAESLAMALGLGRAGSSLQVQLPPEPSDLDSIDTVPVRRPVQPPPGGHARPVVDSRTDRLPPKRPMPPQVTRADLGTPVSDAGKGVKLALIALAAVTLFTVGVITTYFLLGGKKDDPAKPVDTAVQASATPQDQALKEEEERNRKRAEAEKEAQRKKKEAEERQKREKAAEDAAAKYKAVAQIGNRSPAAVTFSFRWRLWDGTWTQWQEDSIQAGTTFVYNRVGAKAGELRYEGRGGKTLTVPIRFTEIAADGDIHKAKSPHQHFWQNGDVLELEPTDLALEESRLRQRGVVVIDNPTAAGDGHLLYKIRWCTADGHTWTKWTDIKVQNGYHYVHSWVGATGCQVEFDGVGGDKSYTRKVLDLKFTNLPASKEAKFADGTKYFFQYKDGTTLDLLAR